MYAGDLVLCGELEEDLRVKVGWFVEVCRRGLKVNAGILVILVSVMLRAVTLLTLINIFSPLFF